MTYDGKNRTGDREPGALLVSSADGVLHLRLNSPARRNPLSSSVLRRLVAEVAGTDAGVIVLEGSRDCFSAGADLAEIEGSPRDDRIDDEVAAAVAALRSTGAVVIGAIEGPCIGAAVDLASAFDLRIASASAFFEVPAVRLGLLYNPAAVDGMVRRLGRPAVCRLLLLGERVGAEEAFHLGVVDQLTAAGAAGEVAGSLARKVAVAELRDVRAATKRLLDEVGRAGFDPTAWQALRDRHAESPVRRDALRRVTGPE
ncbi:MAG: enoyl-CoA hydratase/isomerase family protein [Actinobacteria bacterium]|nr:enoyl-CoA hydratase/isomerase family protein [Actinomycetota bacterium]